VSGSRAAIEQPEFVAHTWQRADIANFEKPFSEPPQDLRSLFGDPGNLDVWVKEARQASPKTKVVVLKFFESYAT
jgi:hypothetical protein